MEGSTEVSTKLAISAQNVKIEILEGQGKRPKNYGLN